MICFVLDTIRAFIIPFWILLNQVSGTWLRYTFYLNSSSCLSKTLVLGKLCRVAITIYKHYYKNLNHAVEGPKKLVNVTEQWSASIYWPCGDWVICRIFVMSPFAIEMASMAFGSDFLTSHTYQVYKIKVVQFNWSTWLELMLSSIRWDDQSVRAVPWTFSWQLSEETPWMFINPLNPKIWLSILPSSCYIISCT